MRQVNLVRSMLIWGTDAHSTRVLGHRPLAALGLSNHYYNAVLLIAKFFGVNESSIMEKRGRKQ
jgi:hypothetical protein